jgi:O-antigen ligase
VIVCLIALSQWFWGWKIHGTKIIESEPRARVLFSHPLSLAYIVLLYTPLALFFLLHRERRRVAMIGTAACGVLLFTSASRTVQVVSMLFATVWCLFFLRGKMRVALIATGLVGVSVLALTENPVRARFQNTIGQIEDRQQDKYADDRLAFWAAHWEMFKERPVMGHGNSYTQEYLSPYYARIGLADFEKKYQAHNMFLQVLVNTGIVGALIWSTRLLMLFFAASKLLRRKLPGERSFGWAGLATVFAVLLAGITQNAFQDSAVRFHWAILEGLLLWKAVSQGKKSSKFILAANKESTP